MQEFPSPGGAWGHSLAEGAGSGPRATTTGPTGELPQQAEPCKVGPEWGGCVLGGEEPSWALAGPQQVPVAGEGRLPAPEGAGPSAQSIPCTQPGTTALPGLLAILAPEARDFLPCPLSLTSGDREEGRPGGRGQGSSSPVPSRQSQVAPGLKENAESPLAPGRCVSR